MTMIAPARMDHRQHVLRALGVTPYGLRARFGPSHAQSDPGGTTAAHGEAASCVLVLPDHCDARQRTLLDRIVQALDRWVVPVERLGVAGGELATPAPRADVYLAFGEAQARALEQALPAAALAQAQVLQLDAPADLFRAAGKRRLWQAVRGLHQRVPDMPGGTG